MKKSLLLLVALAVVGIAGQGPGRERQVIDAAADALGGRNRILALRTLRIEGYGQLAYQNGGGNISPLPDAPMKWVNVIDLVRTIDLERGRMRVQQRNQNAFVFAARAPYLGSNRTNAVIDGDIAFNVGADGRTARASAAVARARRMEMLAHPIVIIRTALNPSTRLSNLRTLGSLQLIDLRSSQGETLTLAVDRGTRLPAWVSWMGPNEDLGDVTFRTHFVGYLRENGVLMPTGFNTTIDFRNVVQNKLYVDKNVVDGPVDDMEAPQSVRAASPDVAPPSAQATPVAPHVWLIQGNGGANSVLFEFGDHLTLFEAPSSNVWTKAVIERARATVPGKPVTEVIVSHHHFDHTGGFRQAVAEGLTIITERSNIDLFRELAARPAKVFPDALATTRRSLRITPVNDHLKLKDATNEVDVYHVIANMHMSAALFAYVPAARLLVQGDFYDVGWELHWWKDTYAANIEHRKLIVERDVPVHGRVLPVQEVFDGIRKQADAAAALCKSAGAAGFFLPGCPLK